MESLDFAPASAPVKAALVNWLPWVGVENLRVPYFASASSRVATQKIRCENELAVAGRIVDHPPQQILGIGLVPGTVRGADLRRGHRQALWSNCVVPPKPKAGDRTRAACAPLATMWNLSLIK
jgi:hypothetical protein